MQTARNGRRYPPLLAVTSPQARRDLDETVARMAERMGRWGPPDAAATFVADVAELERTLAPNEMSGEISDDGLETPFEDVEGTSDPLLAPLVGRAAAAAGLGAAPAARDAAIVSSTRAELPSLSGPITSRSLL